MNKAKRLIVAVTGASGVVLGDHLVKALKSQDETEVHLIVTRSAEETWAYETDRPLDALTGQADAVYDETDLTACISNGSYPTDGMVIIPCSMKTLAGIVSGYAESLVLRAADVCLKENRRLLLVPREMPLSRLHLRNLQTAAELGCGIIPPMLTFYNRPATVQDQIDHVIGKVMMQLGLTYPAFKAWRDL